MVLRLLLPGSVNSTALVGGSATDRDRWFDTSEYSSEESLSVARRCRAGGGVGGDLNTPSPSPAASPQIEHVGKSVHATERRPSTERFPEVP